MADSVEGPSSRIDDKNDLGFGSVVSNDSSQRLLNKDGTFNVRRAGLGWLESQSLYHDSLNLTWPKFLGWVTLLYVVINILFAALFWLCGPEALMGSAPRGMGGSLWRAFFFSVETFATIGYGEISPVGFPAHMVMVVESLFALMSQALITGLLFARFSRPRAAIRFSSHMVVAPFEGGRGLMFRITNTRSNQIIDLQARVTCSWKEAGSKGMGGRRFQQLTLQRSQVIFFPLAWTIVHPITADSPIFGRSDEQMRDCEYEFLILISGTDETFSQQVNTRTSYRADEIVWGAKFRNIFNPPDAKGLLSVDVHRLDEYDVVPLPAA